MAVEVVVGAPFSGKARFARQEIERREAAGELGLIALDWTALYLALFPGEQSKLRDEAVSDTGAPRAAGAAFDFMVGAILARELAGYVLTQSPRRAVELADRLNAPIVEVVADPAEVADRAEDHMRSLRRTVTRAAVGAMRSQCRRQGVAYFREAPQLVGRARVVRRSGSGYVKGETKRPFDRAAWRRGLTPAAREAEDELIAAGTADPTPAEVLSYLLKNRGPTDG